MPVDLPDPAVDQANRAIRALFDRHGTGTGLPPEARAEYERLVDAYLDAVRRRDAA